MIVKILWAIILPLFISTCAFAQMESKVDELYFEFKNTPGVVVAIYKDGNISFSKGYGMANLDYDIPITSKTVFDIGSVSKQFTAACIFLLEQQGKLSIDDPIQKFIPEIPVYHNDKITLRNLINHTSGLRDYAEIMDYAGIPIGNSFTESMGLEMMARQKEPNFKPGEKFMYNNGGYLLLAIVVRRVSGKSIGQFAQEVIFDPLGMKSTFILENPNRVVKNGATAYAKNSSGQFEKQHYYNHAIGGDGQVYTTVEDLFLWDNNFYNPKVGGQPLLSRLRERAILANGDTINYAGGLFIEKHNGHRLEQHGGKWGGFMAGFFRLPDLHTSLVMLANNPGTMLHLKTPILLDLLAPSVASTPSKKKENKSVKLSVKKLGQFRGVFEVIGQPHKRYTIALDHDSLLVTQLWNNESYKLVVQSETSFARKDIPAIQFNFEKQPGLITIRERIETYQATSVKPFDETSIKNLSEYSGEYFSEEVGATYSISVIGNSISWSLKGDATPTLMSVVSQDVFGQQGLGFVFTRNTDGKVNGFLLQDRRIRNLIFNKTK